MSLATILAFTTPGLASAGELRLVFNNGRVTLMAQDVPLREVLAEWERIGGTRIVNRDAVSGAPISIDLVDVAETHALATVLRSAAGYIAFARTDQADAASRFARVVIMPGAEMLAVGPQAAASPQLSGTTADPATERPQVRQRIMPDGRVISVMEYPARHVETPLVVEEETSIQLPQADSPAGMAVPLPPGMSPAPAAPNPPQDSPPGGQESGTPAQLPTQAFPTVPITAAMPGARIPAPKAEPAPYTPQGPPPPPPIKPPGI